MKNLKNTDSISETELCVRWGKCPRSMLLWRKAGFTPPHFKKGRQIRYLLADIRAAEKSKAHARKPSGSFAVSRKEAA